MGGRTDAALAVIRMYTLANLRFKFPHLSPSALTERLHRWDSIKPLNCETTKTGRFMKVELTPELTEYLRQPLRRGVNFLASENESAKVDVK